MPEEPVQMVELSQLKDFIDDTAREVRDEELTGILREIYSLVERVQQRVAVTTDQKQKDKLVNFERDKTISHGVVLEWENVRMGVRNLVLKMANYQTTLFGLLTKRHDHQELHIGLNPRPNFLVGRFRTGLMESNVIPAFESTVLNPRDVLKTEAGIINWGDSSMEWFLRSSVIGKMDNREHLSANGKTPLMLISEFRDSLKKAVEQLGA